MNIEDLHNSDEDTTQLYSDADVMSAQHSANNMKELRKVQDELDEGPFRLTATSAASFNNDTRMQFRREALGPSAEDLRWEKFRV